jgi:long-chain acyl-CoA synthetase
MSSPHNFQEKTDYSQHLKFKNFFDLYSAQKNVKGNFLTYYSPYELEISLTYKDYFIEVEKYLYFLKNELNVGKGETVAVSTGNSYKTLIIYSAILLNESIIVPINTEESKDYTESIMKFSGAKYLFHFSKSQDRNEKHININSLQLTKRLIPTESSQDINSIATIFYTSGTTGNPKGVQLSIGNLFINSVATAKLHGVNEKSSHFTCLPLCHVNAFSFSYLTNLYYGASLVLQKNFTPINYWKIIKEHQVNIVSSTPQIINLLNSDLREIDFQQYPELKYFVSASAPLSCFDVETFIKKFNVRINQAYGLSETVNFSLTIPPTLSQETYNKVMILNSPPSAGSSVFGNSVEIMDVNSSTILQENETGELVIRGWNVFNGYLDNETETKIAFRHKYFHTGDIGYFKIVDNTKFLFISGRIKEIIKRNGQLVYLAEVEAFLKARITNSTFCVVGFKNKFTGEELGIVTEDIADLKTKAIEKILMLLPDHKRPKVIIQSEVLRTSTGKPRRLAMTSLFSDYLNIRIQNNITVFTDILSRNNS